MLSILTIDKKQEQYYHYECIILEKTTFIVGVHYSKHVPFQRMVKSYNDCNAVSQRVRVRHS